MRRLHEFSRDPGDPKISEPAEVYRINTGLPDQQWLATHVNALNIYY